MLSGNCTALKAYLRGDAEVRLKEFKKKKQTNKFNSNKADGKREKDKTTIRFNERRSILLRKINKAKVWCSEETA